MEEPHLPNASTHISKSNLARGAADLVRGRPVRPDAVEDFKELESKLNLKDGTFVDRDRVKPNGAATSELEPGIDAYASPVPLPDTTATTTNAPSQAPKPPLENGLPAKTSKPASDPTSIRKLDPVIHSDYYQSNRTGTSFGVGIEVDTSPDCKDNSDPHCVAGEHKDGHGGADGMSHGIGDHGPRSISDGYDGGFGVDAGDGGSGAAGGGDGASGGAGGGDGGSGGAGGGGGGDGG